MHARVPDRDRRAALHRPHRNRRLGRQRPDDHGRQPRRRELRARLNLKPGDVVRYRVTDTGVIIDKLPPQADEDTLAAFAEWGSPADAAAYANL